MCAIAELLAFHVQPGREISFSNIVSAMWSLGITSLFSIISSHKIEAKARRNFAIANDFWRNKAQKKEYLEAQYSSRCGGSFCFRLKDSAVAAEYSKFEEEAHSKYVLSKIASTIFICIVGSIATQDANILFGENRHARWRCGTGGPPSSTTRSRCASWPPTMPYFLQ